MTRGSDGAGAEDVPVVSLVSYPGRWGVVVSIVKPEGRAPSFAESEYLLLTIPLMKPVFMC